MLEIRDVRKRYGDLEVLRGVNLIAEQGELVGIIGPNGSGKSTLMHCAAGIVEPDSGKITIAGVPHREGAAKEAFAFVPDDLPLPQYLTGAEYVDLVRSLRKGFSPEAADWIAKILGINQDLGKLVGHYSHGMKKKLQVATAFASRPRLLILDEPFSGLDPQTYLTLDAAIQELRANDGAVLASTHDLRLAQRYFDRVYILHAGAIIATGSPSDICRKNSLPSLTEVFVNLTGDGQRPDLDVKRLIGELYE